MEPKPTCLRHLSLILYIFFCLAPAVLAAPARKGLLNLRQPDGTIVHYPRRMLAYAGRRRMVVLRPL